MKYMTELLKYSCRCIGLALEHFREVKYGVETYLAFTKGKKLFACILSIMASPTHILDRP